MPNTISRLSALSRIFSSTVLREMSVKGRSPLFSRLFDLAGLRKNIDGQETVASGFESAFAALRKSGGRDEYVYKAALTHNILLGKHSLNTASMLTEFRVGSAKADVVVLNGTSTVYEIKSDRDSLSRLASQIENYRKAFAKIYVIAGEDHIESIKSNTSDDVGILCLARWNRIQTVRDAMDNTQNVCPVTIFESLRTSEATSILNQLGILVPNAPNTVLRGLLRNLFSELPSTVVHNEMVRTLKNTRSLKTHEDQLIHTPESLRPLVLSLRLSNADFQRLHGALQTPLIDTLSWA